MRRSWERLSGATLCRAMETVIGALCMQRVTRVCIVLKITCWRARMAWVLSTVHDTEVYRSLYRYIDTHIYIYIRSSGVMIIKNNVIHTGFQMSYVVARRSWKRITKTGGYTTIPDVSGIIRLKPLQVKVSDCIVPTIMRASFNGRSSRISST